jgi:hypothetical protein
VGVVGMFARLHVYQHRVRVGEEKVVGNVVTDNALRSAPDQEWLATMNLTDWSKSAIRRRLSSRRDS